MHFMHVNGKYDQHTCAILANNQYKQQKCTRDAIICIGGTNIHIMWSNVYNEKRLRLFRSLESHLIHITNTCTFLIALWLVMSNILWNARVWYTFWYTEENWFAIFANMFVIVRNLKTWNVWIVPASKSLNVHTEWICC